MHGELISLVEQLISHDHEILIEQYMTGSCLCHLWQVVAALLLLECNAGGVYYGGVWELSPRVEPPLSSTLQEDPYLRLGGDQSEGWIQYLDWK